MYNAFDRAVLERHVTNVDGNVYCIVNLPEEVVAVIFAYVSRSPASFRDNLLRLIKDGDIQAEALRAGYAPFDAAAERASAFHQRWVINYGHSSVAEHAVAHVGIERISRLASADLELANPFLSFTEYSQRYQKPLRGSFYIPGDLPSSMVARYCDVMNSLYDAYEELYQKLVPFLDHSLPLLDNESATARQSRIEKLAFEDARYVLPLATLTNLGMTGNGRALRDSIARLRAALLPESRNLADQVAIEVGKVLPTLLRHATPSPYQQAVQQFSKHLTHYSKIGLGQAGPEAHLLSYTGQEASDPEQAALQTLVAAWEAREQTESSPEQLLSVMLSHLGAYDTLPDVCHWIRYDCLFILSEAAWHQLLRHTRGMSFQWGPPEVVNGYTVPPVIAKAGLASVMENAIHVAEELHQELLQCSPEIASYAVTNAHRRRIRAELDLCQLYHLVNLRVSEHAQWDIRSAVTQLWEQTLQVHPRLCAKASRRSEGAQ